MKITFFLPSLRGGGAERMFLHLANAFTKEKYEVDLLLAKAEGAYLTDVLEKVNVIGLEKSRVLFCLPDLTQYFRKSQPDVFLSAMNHANLVTLFAKLLSRQNRTKTFVSIRNTLSKTIGVKKGNTILRLKVMKWLYEKADGIITVSDGVADDFKNLFNITTDKVKTIYNPVINEQLKRLSKEQVKHPWFQPNTLPVVLGCGRLTEQKDFQSLIRAFRQVNEKCNVRLVILGEGEERGKLEALISQLDLIEKVDLLGFVDNPFKYMKRADVFVLSSRWEGLPGVLIQAMACYTPVVSTDCPSGPREILNDGKYGELVEVGNVDDLAQGILKTLQNDVKNGGDKELYRFEEKHAIKKFCDLIGIQSE